MKEKDLQAAGTRPDGVPGLLIDEIELEAITRTPKGLMARVSSPGDPRRHLLRVGDQLFDGDVVNIDQKEVVFKQVVADPAAPKPYREVVKRLPGV